MLPSGIPLGILGPNHPYRQDISKLPVDTRLIAATYGGPTGGDAIVKDTVDAHVRTWNSAKHGMMIAGGIAVTAVNSKTDPSLFITVKNQDGAYWGESDSRILNPDGSRQTAPSPVRTGKIEAGDDRHVLVVDLATGRLHELYSCTRTGTGAAMVMTCMQYSCWDMATGTRVGMPDKYGTSADAAGLPIAPFLVRK